MNMTARQNTTSNSTPVITNGITTATTLVSVLLAIALVDSLVMVVGVTVDCELCRTEKNFAVQIAKTIACHACVVFSHVYIIAVYTKEQWLYHNSLPFIICRLYTVARWLLR